MRTMEHAKFLHLFGGGTVTTGGLGLSIPLQGLQVWNPNMKHIHRHRSYQAASLPSVCLKLFLVKYRSYLKSNAFLIWQLIMNIHIFIARECIFEMNESLKFIN